MGNGQRPAGRPNQKKSTRQRLWGIWRGFAHTSSLDTDLTRTTRAPHFTPQHWLLCHMGLYKFEFEFGLKK